MGYLPKLSPVVGGGLPGLPLRQTRSDSGGLGGVVGSLPDISAVISGTPAVAGDFVYKDSNSDINVATSYVRGPSGPLPASIVESAFNITSTDLKPLGDASRVLAVQHIPGLAGLSNTVLVYTNNNGLNIQIVAGDTGEDITGQIQVAPSTNIVYAAIAVDLNSKNFVVAFTDIGVPNTQFRIFNSSGVPLTAATLVSAGSDTPSVAYLPNGQFVVAFNNNTNRTPQFRRYSAAGALQGATVTVQSSATDGGSPPKVCPFADSSFAIVHQISASNTVNFTIYNSANTVIVPTVTGPVGFLTDASNNPFREDGISAFSILYANSGNLFVVNYSSDGTVRGNSALVGTRNNSNGGTQIFVDLSGNTLFFGFRPLASGISPIVRLFTENFVVAVDPNGALLFGPQPIRGYVASDLNISTVFGLSPGVQNRISALAIVPGTINQRAFYLVSSAGNNPIIIPNTFLRTVSFTFLGNLARYFSNGDTLAYNFSSSFRVNNNRESTAVFTFSNGNATGSRVLPSDNVASFQNNTNTAILEVFNGTSGVRIAGPITANVNNAVNLEGSASGLIALSGQGTAAIYNATLSLQGTAAFTVSSNDIAFLTNNQLVTVGYNGTIFSFARYNSSGTLQGANTDIETVGRSVGPFVSASPNGNFTVAYITTAGNLRVATYSSTGALVSAPRTVATADTTRGLDIAHFSDSSYILAYYRAGALYFARFSAQDEALGVETMLSGAAFDNTALVTTLGSQRFIINGGSSFVYALHPNGTYTLLGIATNSGSTVNVRRQGSVTGLPNGAPRLASFTNGRTAAVVANTAVIT